MIGIKTAGIFLTLKPGTSSEVERKSPFFAINDFTSEYSTPVTAEYSRDNAPALLFFYQYYTVRKKTKIPAQLYDGSTFKCNCTFVVESMRMNLNRVEDTEITGYLLYGISEFYSKIKDVKLSDLTLGGAREFNWTTNAPDDASNGFWQHIHATWTDPTIPYVFYPVRNEQYFGENGTVEWMNKLGNDGKILYDVFLPLVPMITYKYLLEQVFVEFGYKVTFELGDTEWQKLTLVNLVKVDWIAPKPVMDSEANVTIQAAPADKIYIDLRRHVPQDKTISDFLVQTFGRYGWATVFNNLDNTVRIVAGKELLQGTRKDWTPYAEPIAPNNFNEDEKLFAFSNDIDSNDSLPSAPDFTGVIFLKPAYSIHAASVPDAALEGKVRFFYLENKYYQVTLNSDTNEFEYVLFADNIYNYEPTGYTDTITTTVSTLPIYFTLYRTSGGTDYYGFFPMMEQEATKKIGYRTLIYHGLVWELKSDYTRGEIQYPYASSIGVTPLADNTLPWSDVYYHNKLEGSPEQVINGIIPYWWTKLLKILQAGEEPVFNMWLPLHEYNAFRWDDEILIQNVRYLVKSIIEPMPYRGFVQMTYKRIIDRKDAEVVIGPATDGNVYAQIVITNTSQTTTGFFTFKYCDVVINLYSDADGTIPYTPSAPLYVYVKITTTVDNNGTVSSSDTAGYYAANASTQVIMSHVSNGSEAHITFPSTLTITFTVDYSLDPSGAYGYLIL